MSSHFSDGSVVKNLPVNAGNMGSIPGSGRSPEAGNGNPLQDSCLGNLMDREAWRATVHGIARVRHDLWLNTLATWCEELTHLKRPWCWERLKAGGEGDDTGWDNWMASPTPWVWVNSGSWWWTGRPSLLQSMGSQRVGHNWVTKLNWTAKWEEIWAFPSNIGSKTPFCTRPWMQWWPSAGLKPPERPPALERRRPACRFLTQMDKNP